MKLKKGAIGIGFVLAIVATVLLMLLPVSVNLYIAYVCCLIGICMMMLSAIFFDKRDVPGSFAQLMQVAWFLPASLAVSVIVLIFIPVPPLVHGVAQFLLCAIAAIRLIGVNAGKDSIRAQGDKVSEKTLRIAEWLNAVESIAAPSPDAQTALRKLREAIRYSDPMSNDSVAEIDESITTKIFELQTDANNTEALVSDCEAICSELKHRNNILKSTKA